MKRIIKRYIKILKNVQMYNLDIYTSNKNINKIMKFMKKIKGFVKRIVNKMAASTLMTPSCMIPAKF